MPKYNDFDLDLQNETDIQLYAENPTRATIDGPSGTTYCTISRKYQDCPVQG